MEETIKDIEVIAYKGMKSDMTCKGFQYEIGKSYKTDRVELCKWGFHACLNPRDVFGYYPKYHSSRYFKVKLFGEITKCDETDTKVAATEISILEEINIDEIIKNTEWWKNENILDLLYWSDGFSRVQRANSDCNFIDKDGNYLYNDWFEWLGYFSDGFARVERTNGEWNFIDKKGNYLSDEWYKWVDDFKAGWAVVQRTNGKWTKIDRTGNLIKILQ